MFSKVSSHKFCHSDVNIEWLRVSVFNLVVAKTCTLKSYFPSIVRFTNFQTFQYFCKVLTRIAQTISTKTILNNLYWPLSACYVKKRHAAISPFLCVSLATSTRWIGFNRPRYPSRTTTLSVQTSLVVERASTRTLQNFRLPIARTDATAFCTLSLSLFFKTLLIAFDALSAMILYAMLTTGEERCDRNSD